MAQSKPIPAGDVAEHLLDAMLEQVPGAFAWLDPQGRVRLCNRGFRGLVPADCAACPDWDVCELFPAVEDARWREVIAAMGTGDAEVRQSLALTLRDGRAIELTLRPLTIGDERWIAAQVRDLGVRQEGESIQRLQHEVLEAVAVGKPIQVVMELLCRGFETMAPEAICTVLLISKDGRVHPCAAPSMPPVFSQAIDGVPIGPRAGSCGTAAWRGEPVEVTDIAHDPLWDDYRALALPLGLAACWSSPIRLRSGRVAATFAVYYREPRAASPFHRRIVDACVHLCSLAIEHEEAERQIQHLAYYDPLTGLANRTLLRDRAQMALSRAVREHKPLALLFVDLDRFKNVNDSLGHHSGDRMLKTVAERLCAERRATDTVARFGGDEFVVLLPDTGEPQARVVAEHLLARLTEPIRVDGIELTPSASIGISLAPEDAVDFDTLQRNADVAMYQAKSAGRNTYRFFQPQMNEAVIERLELESALRRAIADGALDVVYQPQVTLADGRVYGFEALARWRHPVRGEISPGLFVPLAEDAGFIEALDEYVLHRACAQRAAWRSQGIEAGAVSVNVTARAFRSDDVVERVRRLVQTYRLMPGDLTLEITENVMLECTDATLAVLKALRELGVGLSIDDFGTRFSSLHYLKRFPVHELKLDQSFVHGLMIDASDRALAEAIIQLGRTFGLVVIAEGVESEGQAMFLRERDCAVAQGRHYAWPMPGGEVAAWLHDGTASRS
ncbi:EAL domain-containing protein [Fontimonas sp. SYSU GA230001]|uniref:putative bifunctional diguanylate cyclase/phosphodiesterase n=1 Tax=Fontimonas sp. SYSU GA230001 TaxID=3142450 RepID=UPI0032B4EA9E